VLRTANASKELLASRDDVWTFVSEAGRISDWWPGIFAAQDNGATWTIEGEEREGLSRVADRGDDERQETVTVEKAAPTDLRLHFDRSGYDVHLSLEASAANRTEATLVIGVEERHETLPERLEEVVGGLSFAPSVLGADDSFAESVLDRLYDVCQTGADS
jgi:hypothetical protein